LTQSSLSGKKPIAEEFARAALDEIENQTFDVIFSYYVLEHLRDPIEYLKTLQKYLKPMGRIILEVPNVDDVLLDLSIPPFAPFYWQKGSLL